MQHHEPLNGKWQLEVAETLGRIEATLNGTVADHGRRLEAVEEESRTAGGLQAIHARVATIETNQTFHNRMQYIHMAVVVPLVGGLHIVARKLGFDI